MLIHIIKDTHDIGRGSKCKVFWVLSAICSWVDFFWKFSKIGSKWLSGDIGYQIWSKKMVFPRKNGLPMATIAGPSKHKMTKNLVDKLCPLQFSSEL